MSTSTCRDRSHHLTYVKSWSSTWVEKKPLLLKSNPSAPLALGQLLEVVKLGSFAVLGCHPLICAISDSDLSISLTLLGKVLLYVCPRPCVWVRCCTVCSQLASVKWSLEKGKNDRFMHVDTCCDYKWFVHALTLPTPMHSCFEQVCMCVCVGGGGGVSVLHMKEGRI